MGNHGVERPAGLESKYLRSSSWTFSVARRSLSFTASTAAARSRSARALASAVAAARACVDHSSSHRTLGVASDLQPGATTSATSALALLGFSIGGELRFQVFKLDVSVDPLGFDLSLVNLNVFEADHRLPYFYSVRTTTRTPCLSRREKRTVLHEDHPKQSPKTVSRQERSLETKPLVS